MAMTMTAVLSAVLPAHAPLRPREREVLALIAEGLSTREVARRLCWSERTIKNVLQDLTTRLGLRNRTQAVAWAVRNGWI
jgi:DNA-binding NarL/FixJ family response regulator